MDERDVRTLYVVSEGLVPDITYWVYDPYKDDSVQIDYNLGRKLYRCIIMERIIFWSSLALQIALIVLERKEAKKMIVREVSELDKDLAMEGIVYKLGGKYYVYDSFTDEFYETKKPEFDKKYITIFLIGFAVGCIVCNILLLL